MDINERREALRARVRSKLSGEEEEPEELVVQASEVQAATTEGEDLLLIDCLLYTSPSPRDQRGSRMPSSA